MEPDERLNGKSGETKKNHWESLKTKLSEMRLTCLSALLLDFTYLYTQTKIGFGEVCRIFISEVFRFKKVTRKLQLK